MGKNRKHSDILPLKRVKFEIFARVREQSLRMLQTGVEEFKIYLCKISYLNIKCYFGFVPEQKIEKKLIPQQQRETFNYGSLQQAKA